MTFFIILRMEKYRCLLRHNFNNNANFLKPYDERGRSLSVGTYFNFSDLYSLSVLGFFYFGHVTYQIWHLKDSSIEQSCAKILAVRGLVPKN